MKVRTAVAAGAVSGGRTPRQSDAHCGAGFAPIGISGFSMAGAAQGGGEGSEELERLRGLYDELRRSAQVRDFAHARQVSRLEQWVRTQAGGDGARVGTSVVGGGEKVGIAGAGGNDTWERTVRDRTVRDQTVRSQTLREDGGTSGHRRGSEDGVPRSPRSPRVDELGEAIERLGNSVESALSFAHTGVATLTKNIVRLASTLSLEAHPDLGSGIEAKEETSNSTFVWVSSVAQLQVPPFCAYLSTTNKNYLV
ncbi:hypothetical protein T492DRAFT_204491 [Pavlovales sp. CCMP2436]|nr:hypothetical protein T492DRAFT_204491 [Pavlovales sp. CCMP2436]